MKGVALIFQPDASLPEAVEFDKPADLDWLKGKVGGYIETLPYFNKIPDLNAQDPSALRDCVVFVNEEGLLQNLPVNPTVTELWYGAVKKAGMVRERSQFTGVVVGPAVALYGDEEFMEAL